MNTFFSKCWNTIKTAFRTKACLKWASLAIVLSLTGGVVLSTAACKSGDPDSSSATSSSASSSDGSTDEILNYQCLVRVQTLDGYGLSGVNVHLYKGDEEVTSLKTNSAGDAKFQENILPTLDTYIVKLTDLPVGYKLNDESAVYQTAAIKGMKVTIPLMPTGVIKETAPQGKTYKLGDVMYDFSLTLSDGTTTTLAKILEEKDMVFLNFWALRCSPCKQEFPFMNMTYISFYDEEQEIKYSDKMEILALNDEDSQSNINAYKNGDAALKFEMLNDNTSGAKQANYFDLSAIPVSAVIDRYGVVAYLHTGNLSSVSQFKALFDPFLSENYTPTILREDDVLPGEDDENANRITPTYSNPTESDIQKALGNTDFTYSWDKGEYSWPWLIGEEEGDSYIYSSNKGVDNSYSLLYANFTAKANTALCFDLKMESELYGIGLDGDFFYVFLDGALVQSVAGLDWNWKTFCAYVFTDLEAGEHELALYYVKDDNNSSGEDTIQIKNIRFESVDALNSSKEIDAYVIRQAATIKNTDESAKTQYQNYIKPVYNETDGYYHVNTKDGPVLYANVTGSTLFSDYSIYELALAGYSISDGFDLADDISTMAWEAGYNYTNNGYTPVTKQWKELLTEFVACTTYTQKWSGKTHANEWLELCVYYDHYGDTPLREDPMLGITCNAAPTIKEGTTKVDVPFELMPRGFKYKFVPTKSGVYNIYSLAESDDTLCYLADERLATKSIPQLWESAASDYLLGEFAASFDAKDGNFNFHYYFEQGKTYYLLLCYADSATYGSYNVKIDYVGKTHTYLAPAGTTLTFSETQTDLFYVLDGVEFEKSATDGYYHVKNADGTLGSILYLDTANANYYWDGSFSLETALSQNRFDTLLIDGVDYTQKLEAICAKGKANTTMPGYVAVDQEVYDCLTTVLAAQSMPALNDWLLMCYYYKTLG